MGEDFHPPYRGIFTFCRAFLLPLLPSFPPALPCPFPPLPLSFLWIASQFLLHMHFPVYHTSLPPYSPLSITLSFTHFHFFLLISCQPSTNKYKNNFNKQ